MYTKKFIEKVSKKKNVTTRKYKYLALDNYCGAPGYTAIKRVPKGTEVTIDVIAEAPTIAELTWW